MINYSSLKNCILFNGIKEKNYKSVLNCLDAYSKKYKKGEIILNSTENLEKIGIILEGNIQIAKEDYFGNRDILANIKQSELFGESFIASKKSIPITILSKEDSTILYIHYTKLITTCSNSCEFHNKLIENMLKILSIKNVYLTQKIEYMSKKTIKEKILAYLSAQAIFNNSNSFDIPFNRQELADYLSTDRSALSNELGKLRDLGTISFYKNHFTIFNIENK